MATNGRRGGGFMTQEGHTEVPCCHTVAQEQTSFGFTRGQESECLAGHLNTVNFCSVCYVKHDKEDNFMNLFKAAGLGSLLGSSLLMLTTPASAGMGFNHRHLAKDIRNDRADVRRDVRDLHKDRRDLANDRRDLRQDLRHGATPADIARDRRDIQRDRNDIVNDRHDLRGDLRDLNRDLSR